MNAWEKYVELKHLSGEVKDFMERKQRRKQVRYLLFRFKNDLEQGRSLKDPVPEDYPQLQIALPGFVDFWLVQKPLYAVRPDGSGKLVKVKVHERLKGQTVAHLGGYLQFAKKWDVDYDLNVYLRWSSVWQEWNATLAKVVPIIGEEDGS